MTLASQLQNRLQSMHTLCRHEVVGAEFRNNKRDIVSHKSFGAYSPPTFDGWIRINRQPLPMRSVVLPGTGGLCKQAGARSAAGFKQHRFSQLEHEVCGGLRRLVRHGRVDAFPFISGGSDLITYMHVTDERKDNKATDKDRFFKWI